MKSGPRFFFYLLITSAARRRITWATLTSLGVALLTPAPLYSAVDKIDVKLTKTITADRGDDNRFSEIAGIYGNKDGHVYLADAKSGVLVRFTSDTSASTVLSGEKQIFESERLGGLARLGDGLMAVVNSGDSFIAVIDDNGKLQYTVGESGSVDGRLSTPMGIAYSPRGRLYVADSGNNRISVYSRDGVFLFSFGKPDTSTKQSLREPKHIGVDAAENIYVLDNDDEARVSIYSYDGKLLKRISAKKLGKDSGRPPTISAMAVNPEGDIYLVNQTKGKILQLDWRNGKIINSFGSKGKSHGQFLDVTSLAVTPTNQLIVGDSGNKKVDIYNLRPPKTETETETKNLRLPLVLMGGTYPAVCDKAYPLPNNTLLCLNREKRFVASLSAKGEIIRQFDGQFENPSYAAFDNKSIAIADDNQIKLFAYDGKLRFVFGRRGSKDGEFRSIAGVILHEKIFVSDADNQRIQIFTPDGVFVDKLTNSKDAPEIIRNPGPIALDAQGKLYVGDNDFKKIRVFSADKKFLYELGDGEKSRNRYIRFDDIAIDPNNDLYVLGSTIANEHTVRIYRDRKLLLSFGSSMEKGVGMSEPTTLTVPPSANTTVSIYDKKRRGLQDFLVLQVPERISGLAVRGGTKQTDLRWARATDSYIAHYRVYGATDKNGPFERILETKDHNITITHGTAGQRHVFYRVSAVSGFDVEGAASQTVEDLFQTASQLYQNRRYAESSELFLQVYENNPGHAETLEYLGLSLSAQGRHEDAFRRFKDLATMPGFETKAVNFEAETLFKSKQFLVARAVLDTAIASGHADATTYMWCGKVSLHLGDAIGAVDCLEKLVALDPEMTSAGFLLAHAYLKAGVNTKGLAQYDRMLEIVPNDTKAWIQSALAYQILGQHDKALERFNRALAIDQINREARLGAAQSYISLKKYEEARSIALSMSGDAELEGAGHYLLGIIATANGQMQEAVLSLGKAARKDPQNPSVWVALAEANLTLGKTNKARDALKKAASSDPESFDIQFKLGLLEVRNKNYREARKLLAKAVNLQPRNYDARITLAETLFALGEYNKAAKHAREAAKLAPDNNKAIVLLADIFHRLGKNGEAIDYLKRALALEPASATLEIKLGQLYMENNVFDLAQKHLEKSTLIDTNSARPHILLGQLFLNNRRYDEAIASFSKAVKLDPSEENKLQLNTAYANKKKALTFKDNAPLIVLQNLKLKRIFSATYKQYADLPVGSIKVRNTGPIAYKNLKLTFHIKGYMDFPSSREIPSLKAKKTIEAPLFASFNNKILNIDEDTGVQVEVKLNFFNQGKQNSIDVTQPMTIYGKNAVIWGNPTMVGSFVTRKDETLNTFVRQVINKHRPDKGPLNQNIISAMTLFNSLSAYGMKYTADPNTPFSKITVDQVDYVQFPRETLKLKSGDCDDLSVLLSAGLENIGIETAIIDIPGHLFFMFNTGLSEKNKDLISLQDDLLVIRNGAVWIPVEATMVATSFLEAWAEGARKYQEAKRTGKLNVISLKKAWKHFPPVTLAPEKYEPTLPTGDRVEKLISQERATLVTKYLERLVRPYHNLLAHNPKDEESRMQISIIYAKNGLFDIAMKEFDKLLETNPVNSGVYNNRGNIYFTLGNYDRALTAYQEAEKLDSTDGGIKLNLALTLYKLGNVNEAGGKYSEAIALNKSLAKKYGTLEKLLRN